MTTKEKEAARNNDLLQAVINAMTEGLMFVTHDGNVAICNPAAKLWKGGPTLQNGHIDKSSDSPEDFPPILTEHIKTISAGGNKAIGASGGRAIEFDTADPEQRYIEAKSSPVVGTDGQRLG